MRNIIILSILALTLVGCGSSSPDASSSNVQSVHVLTHNEAISNASTIRQQVPITECERFEIVCSNGTIMEHGPYEVKSFGHKFIAYVPKGGSVYLTIIPDAGYKVGGFEGMNTVVGNDATWTNYGSAGVANVVMIPVGNG